MMLGGGFGRRLPFTFDYVDIGVRVAKAMSPAPVKTIWTRENDIQHDYYRGAALSRHAGALDASGVPLAANSNYTGGGNGEAVFMPYAIAQKNADEKKADHPIRLGQWRSVLNSQHGFFKESFIDEMAHAAGKDHSSSAGTCWVRNPASRRSSKGGGDVRLEFAAPACEGRGIAICESFGTIAGRGGARQGCRPEGRLKVIHVYAAIDCGDVVNLGRGKVQVEGGIIFASAALLSEST